MSRKLTKEEFINREPDLLNGEYEFIGDYKGSNVKTLFKHNTCEYEYMVVPSQFHWGKRCPKCSGHTILTKETFCQRETDIVSGEYKMMGMYVNTKTKTLFRHNFCGCEWMTTPENFYRGVRCPKCRRKEFARKRSLTKRMFCSGEKDIQSGEYEILGKYVNTSTKTLFRHNACGYEWETRPRNFRMGKRCPRCAGNIKFTKEEFCNKEEDILSGEYEFAGEYINTNTKTSFKHSICGYEWKIAPCSFHSGIRCPKCNQSKGEKSITNILKKINIPFETQKRFNSCRYKKTLPFDFYVNNSFLIEYDGKQHFKPVNHFGGNKEFNLRQLRDSIKTKWAKDNGIPLVRIPYTEFDNIEQIIKDNIEKYSIQKAG